MRPAVELDLPLRLDRSAPLQRQLVGALRDAVLSGALPAGRRLPASRTLADRLGVGRTTVVAAFEQLLGEGVLEARHGAGTFVAAGAVPVPRPSGTGGGAGEDAPTPTGVDLRPGRPDTARLVDAAWRRAWRDAVARIPADEPPAAGLPALRAAVAEHVAGARGAPADPAGVVVTAGTREALAVTVPALGLRRVGVEDPGYAAAVRTLRTTGVDPVPLPVDEGGLVVAGLPEGGLDAVLVTPSHQYPLGGTMPLARRTALLAWARRTGTAVLEDDYDGEFRFDVLPLPALAALDPDVVLHVGTFAKSVSPWLRAGYLLVPPRHRKAVLRARADLGQPVDGVTQAALAGYLASGALARHIARSRRDHAHRREHLLALLADRPGLAARGSSAGLHLVVELPDDVDAAAVVDAVAERGTLLADLDAYRLRSAGRPAVVLGYGAARLHELDAAVAALAAAVDAVRPGGAGRPPVPPPGRG